MQSNKLRKTVHLCSGATASYVKLTKQMHFVLRNDVLPEYVLMERNAIVFLTHVGISFHSFGVQSTLLFDNLSLVINTGIFCPNFRVTGITKNL